MTWAIAADLSDVIETPDGFGRFPTKLAALGAQIDMLNANIGQLKEYRTDAKRQRRKELAK